VKQARALAGIAAPLSFIGAWVVAGARTPGSSPVAGHISELAAVGAPNRPLMTAGMVGFGVLAPLWATSVPGRGQRAALLTAGAGTLGVAALPLGGSLGDAAHACAAAVAYVGMALVPALGARSQGTPALSYGAGALAAALLIASTVGPCGGALQRAGLGVTDVWMAVQAARQLR
jgi:hypothetical protein